MSSPANPAAAMVPIAYSTVVAPSSGSPEEGSSLAAWRRWAASRRVPMAASCALVAAQSMRSIIVIDLSFRRARGVRAGPVCAPRVAAFQVDLFPCG